MTPLSPGPRFLFVFWVLQEEQPAREQNENCTFNTIVMFIEWMGDTFQKTPTLKVKTFST